MSPKVDLRSLGRGRPRDYVVRFLFGGAVALALAFVGRAWGPTAAGLLLAFPSVLPASLTLLDEHDGRAKAVDDARGAMLGGIGCIAFALVLHATARSWAPAPALATATVTWLLVTAGLWALRYGRERPKKAA